MTPEQVQNLIGAGIFVAAFVFGVRASFNISRRYRNAMGAIDARNRPVLLLIAIVCWFLTGLAGWIGGLSVVRLIGDITLPWTPPITLVLATITVFIPVAFDNIIAWVAGEPYRGLRALLGLAKTPPGSGPAVHEDEDKEKPKT